MKLPAPPRAALLVYIDVLDLVQDHKPLCGLPPIPEKALERQAEIAAQDLAASSALNDAREVLQACIVNGHVLSVHCQDTS